MKCVSKSSFYQVCDIMPCWHHIHNNTGLHLAILSQSEVFSSFVFPVLHTFLSRVCKAPPGFFSNVIAYKSVGPPFTSTITVRTFFFAARSISEVKVIAVETIDSVQLLLTDTAFISEFTSGISQFISPTNQLKCKCSCKPTNAHPGFFSNRLCYSTLIKEMYRWHSCQSGL